MAELILNRKGNWVLKRYSHNKKFTYWVMTLPDMEVLIEFPNLKKAREYFELATKN